MNFKRPFVIALYAGIVWGQGTSIGAVTFKILGDIGYGNLSDKPYSLALSPDRQHIAIACGMGVVVAERNDKTRYAYRNLLVKKVDNVDANLQIQVVEFIDTEFVTGGGDDGKVWLWNINRPMSPSVIDNGTGDPDNPVSYLVATDKNHLLVVYFNSKYHIINGLTPYESGKITEGSLFASGSRIHSVSYNYRQKVLAATTAGKNVIYFFRYTGNELKPLTPLSLKSNSSYSIILRYSPDGKYLAYGQQNSVTVLNASNNKVVGKFQTALYVTSIEFSMDSRYLFVAHYSSYGEPTTYISVISLETMQSRKPMGVDMLKARINFMLFIPSDEPLGGYLAVTSLYHSVIALEPETRAILWSVDGFINDVGSPTDPSPMAYTDTNNLMLLTENSFLFLNDTTFSIDNALPSDFQNRFVDISSMSGEGGAVAVNLDGTVLIFRDGTVVDSFSVPELTRVTAMDVADGRFFVGGDDGVIVVVRKNHTVESRMQLKAASGTAISELNVVGVGQGQMMLFAGTKNGSVFFIRYNGRPSSPIPINTAVQQEVTSIDYSPQGLLAVGYRTGEVSFYSFKGNRFYRLGQFTDFEEPVVKMQFLKGSDYLLVAYPSAMLVLAMNSGTVNIMYNLHTKGLCNIALSPNDERVSVLHDYGRISVMKILYGPVDYDASSFVATATAQPEAHKTVANEPVAEETTGRKPFVPPTSLPSPNASSDTDVSQDANIEAEGFQAQSQPNYTPSIPMPQAEVTPQPTAQPQPEPQMAVQSSPNNETNELFITSPMPLRGRIISIPYSQSTITVLRGHVNRSVMPLNLMYSLKPIVGQHIAYNPELSIDANGNFSINIQAPSSGIYQLVLQGIKQDGQVITKSYFLKIGEVSNIYLIVYGLDAPGDPQFPAVNGYTTSARAFYQDLREGLALKRSNVAYFVGKNAIPSRFIEKLRRFVMQAGDTGLVIVGLFAPTIIDPQNPYAFYILGYYTKPNDIPSSSIASYMLKNTMRINRSRKIVFFDGVNERMLKWYYQKSQASSIYSDFSDFLSSLNDAVLAVGDSVQSICLVSSSQLQSTSYVYPYNNRSYTLFMHLIDSGLHGDADGDGDGVVTLGELIQFIEDRMTQIMPSAQPGVAGNCDGTATMGVVEFLRRRSAAGY